MYKFTGKFYLVSFICPPPLSGSYTPTAVYIALSLEVELEDYNCYKLIVCSLVLK